MTEPAQHAMMFSSSHHHRSRMHKESTSKSLRAFTIRTLTHNADPACR